METAQLLAPYLVDGVTLMLVLARGLKETVFIGDDISIEVISFKGKSTRFKISAPRNIKILRAEIPRFSGSITESDEITSLVLSRKVNQEILIGDNISIKVIKRKGRVVRFGISAPIDVRILRHELKAAA